MSPSHYVEELVTKIPQCGDMYDEYVLTKLFIKGFEASSAIIFVVAGWIRKMPACKNSCLMPHLYFSCMDMMNRLNGRQLMKRTAGASGKAMVISQIKCSYCEERIHFKPIGFVQKHLRYASSEKRLYCISMIAQILWWFMLTNLEPRNFVENGQRCILKCMFG